MFSFWRHSGIIYLSIYARKIPRQFRSFLFMHMVPERIRHEATAAGQERPLV